MAPVVPRQAFSLLSFAHCHFLIFPTTREARARRWAQVRSGVYLSSIVKAAPEPPPQCFWSGKPVSPSCPPPRGAWTVGPRCLGSALRACPPVWFACPRCPQGLSALAWLPVSRSSWSVSSTKQRICDPACGRNTRILLGTSPQGGKSNPFSLPGSWE